MLVEELLITPSAHARRSTSFDRIPSQEPKQGSPREVESSDERARKVRSSGTWDEFEDGAALHLPITTPTGSDEQSFSSSHVKGNFEAPAVDRAMGAETNHLSGSGSGTDSASCSIGGSSDYGSSSSSFMSGSGSSLGGRSPHCNSGARRTGVSRVKTSSSSMMSLPEPESPSIPSLTLNLPAKSSEELGEELEGLRTRLNSLSGSGDLSGVAFGSRRSNDTEIETF